MTASQQAFLFLGDCNTCGTDSLRPHCYPSLIGEQLAANVTNLGLTMSTTREALEFAKQYSLESFDGIFIQYGLVDSWKTIRSAPYVLYYPDTTARKLARKWVKKWKKYGRKAGLGYLFGMQNQVPISEYRENLERLIEQASGKPIYLIETPPNMDTSRNPAIRRYNACLLELSEVYANAHCVRIYADLEPLCGSHYIDATHLSEKGHKLVAEEIMSTLNRLNQKQVLENEKD